MQRAHAEWCLHLVEEAEPELMGERQTASFDVLERSATTSARPCPIWTARDEPSSACADGSSQRFWYVRGYLGEGRRWLELRAPKLAAEPRLRRRALTAVRRSRLLQGDYAVATSWRSKVSK